MAQPLRRAQTPEAAAPSRRYVWFAASVGSWFAAIGLQGVVYSALLLSVLDETPARIGLAQAALMIPPVFLVLFGGVVADRRERRSLLVGLYLAAAVLALALCAVVGADQLRFELLIAYALCMGSLSAFVMPASDSLLSEVAGPNLMVAVTDLGLIRWGSQALGNLAGGAARWIGFAPALLLQTLILFAGVAALGRLAPAPPAHAVVPLSLHETLAGLREVARSPVLRPSLLLVMAVGVLFIGPFTVALPVMVRDVYAGDAQLLGLVFMTFPLGTMLGTLVLRARGRLERKGLAQLVALAAGSLTLGAVALALPFAATLALLVLWGVAAALFMTAGRTIFQENAPATHRGRVLSVYTLGFMSASPLGAFLCGFLVGWIGPLATCAWCAAAMLVVVVAAFLFSGATRT